MFKKIFGSKKKDEDLKVNTQISELLNAHGYKSTIVDNKIVPDFKERVEIESWITPTVSNNGVQTRLDVGVKFDNGQELFEAFGDVGVDLNNAIKNNLENFSRCTLHVLTGALNDTVDHIERERWDISGDLYDVYIGDFNMKSTNDFQPQFPQELFPQIEKSITAYRLNEKYYFVRFFFAQMNYEVIATEFMINNVNLPEQEEKLRNLDWEGSDEFYSVRNFIILKKVGEII